MLNAQHSLEATQQITVGVKEPWRGGGGGDEVHVLYSQVQNKWGERLFFFMIFGDPPPPVY